MCSCAPISRSRRGSVGSGTVRHGMGKRSTMPIPCHWQVSWGGTPRSFGPRVAVAAYPPPRGPPPIKVDVNNNNLPYVELYGLVTGDPSAATPSVLFSVDGGPVETARNTDGSTWFLWTYKVSP